MNERSSIEFERLPGDSELDETDINLRAYVAGLAPRHLVEYDRSWSDEQVIAWDGNFRCDGALMLVCCERDVDVREFREVLERYLTAVAEKPNASAG
jgi:hypothetical protein